MADTSLEMSPYKFPFKLLTWLGVWSVESSNHSIKSAFFVYQSAMLFLGFAASGLFSVKFAVVFGDSRKFTWSLLITSMFLGWWAKHLYTLNRCAVLNRLRINLHRTATSGGTPHDEHTNDASLREMKRVELTFYMALVIFVPVWLSSWYFGLMWGERDLPLPFWIPFEVDLKDELQFHLLFTMVSLIGVLGVLFMGTVDIAMHTFLIQISREYERLIFHFTKIEELFGSDGSEGGEVKKPSREMNPYLRDIKVKQMLKEITVRQQELIEYTRDFELGYNFPVLINFFLTSGMFVLCAIIYLLAERMYSLEVFYLVGLLITMLWDISLLCQYTTRIRSQCYSVGDAAYSLRWYWMGIDMQKHISLIILRSQHPPKITSGKILEMDLHALLILIRNIYSCLTLLKQLASNSNE